MLHEKSNKSKRWLSDITCISHGIEQLSRNLSINKEISRSCKAKKIMCESEVLIGLPNILLKPLNTGARM